MTASPGGWVDASVIVAPPRVLIVALDGEAADRVPRLAVELTEATGHDHVHWCLFDRVVVARERQQVDLFLVADADVDEQVRAVRRLKRLADPLPVLVESSATDRAGIVGLVRAGADGIVPRDTGADSIRRCVAAVLSGEFVLPRGAVAHLAVEIRSTPGG